MTDLSTHAAQVAQRIANARAVLVENVQTLGGLKPEQAEAVAAYYIKHRMVKLDAVGGTYRVTYGGFFDRQVLQNAVAVATA